VATQDVQFLTSCLSFAESIPEAVSENAIVY